MRELREDTFSGNKNEYAHDHVDRVLNIVSLFNILGVSQDAVLLRVFPFTLTGSAKRWVDRLTLGAGPNLEMKPTQALMVIETMANHSQKWHDRTSSRNMSSSSDTDGLAAVISKLDNLGRDIKKLKENVHAIQVTHLDKECPLNEEVKQIDEVKTLAAEVETKVAKLEECKTMFANERAPLYTPFYYSLKELEYSSANSGFSDDEKSKRT
ncbi:hypothetical protein Tco_0565828 [Tanacetum coccineum]